MKRKWFSEGQIIGVLREHEAGARTADLAQNTRLKKLLAEQMLDAAPLRELVSKKW